MDSLGLISKRIADAFQILSINAETNLSTIASDIVKETGIKGLTEEMVCQGKTPEKIAGIWLHSIMFAAKAKTDNWNGQEYPLLPYSQVVFNDMKANGEQAWTFCFTLRIPAEQSDTKRLRKAIEVAMSNHPVFSVRIDENGRQHYEHDYHTPYFSYDIEAGIDFHLLRFRFNRILGDAASLQILLEDICYAYFAEPLMSDNYFAYNKKVAEKQSNSEYLQHKEWLQQHYDGIYCLTAPQQDYHDADMAKSLCGTTDECLTDIEEPLKTFCKQNHLSINQFFCLVNALAIMDYNNSDEAALTWSYLGREAADEQRIFGSLNRDIPFYLHRSGNLQELISTTRIQTEQGIIHSEYPYTFHAENRALWKNAVNVLVRPYTQDAISNSPIPFEIIDDKEPCTAYTMLDIEILEHPLTLQVKYSSAHYKQSSIRKYITMLKSNIEQLIKR